MYAVCIERSLRGGHHRGIVAEDFDPFVAGEDARNLRVDPRDGAELTGPVGFVMRPGDPRSPVRFPFRRHS